MAQTIHLELLLHRHVDDPSGESLGRVEEIIVNGKGEILEFRLGPAALLHRWLGAFSSKDIHPVRIAWDQIDFSHINGKRLRATVAVRPREPS